MKRKISFLFLLLIICLVPVISVKAELKEDDINDIDAKNWPGYHCYIVCKTQICNEKMIFYSDRSMEGFQTYDILDATQTQSGSVEHKVTNDSNNVNLFYKILNYPDAEGTETMAFYLNKVIDGKYTEYNEFAQAADKMRTTLWGNLTDLGYSDDEIKAMGQHLLSANEASDISPFECRMAGEMFTILNYNATSKPTPMEEFSFVMEESTKNNSATEVFDINHDTPAGNAENRMWLEGSDFLEYRADSLVGPDDGTYLLSHLWTIDEFIYSTNIYDNYGSEDKEKIQELSICVDEKKDDDGVITHEELTECLICTDEKIKNGKINNDDYMCKNGYTLGAIPVLNYTSEIVQDAIDNEVADNAYYWAFAAWELVPTDRSLSCYDIRYVVYVWRIICILAPILLIIFSSVDYIKTIVASDEKAQNEAKKNIPKRVVAFVLFLMLPVFLRLIFTFGQFNSSNLGLLQCVVTFNSVSKKSVGKNKYVYEKKYKAVNNEEEILFDDETITILKSMADNPKLYNAISKYNKLIYDTKQFGPLSVGELLPYINENAVATNQANKKND